MLLATSPTISPRRVRRRRSPWSEDPSPPRSPPPPPGTGGRVPPLPRPVLGSLTTGSVIVTVELKVAIYVERVAAGDSPAGFANVTAPSPGRSALRSL